MNELRVGCYYCFKTLDSNDTSEILKSFVKCPNCKLLYHEACYKKYMQCFLCGSKEIKYITIKTLPLVTIFSKREMLPIKPSKIVYSIFGKDYEIPEFFYLYLFPTLHDIYKEIVRIINEYLIPAYLEHVKPILIKLKNRGIQYYYSFKKR